MIDLGTLKDNGYWVCSCGIPSNGGETHPNELRNAAAWCIPLEPSKAYPVERGGTDREVTDLD